MSVINKMVNVIKDVMEIYGLVTTVHHHVQQTAKAGVHKLLEVNVLLAKQLSGIKHVRSHAMKTVQMFVTSKQENVHGIV